MSPLASFPVRSPGRLVARRGACCGRGRLWAVAALSRGRNTSMRREAPFMSSVVARSPHRLQSCSEAAMVHQWRRARVWHHRTGRAATYASFVALRTGTCALSSDGHAQCWGRGDSGAIGNGALQDALSPVDVSGGYRFLALAASGVSDFVCGTTDTGRAYCWGAGASGQLGNNTFLSASEPVLVRLIPTSPAATAKRASRGG